ncbi:hypothetical protein BKA80DRAFT_300543 [Phyllosticta citrichinensis]
MALTNTHKNQTDDFDVITDNEVREIQQQQAARAILGLGPTAGASGEGRCLLKGTLRAATAAVATGAAKVAQKMADRKTKTPKELTPEALCPCLADPVNGWMSCKIYGHVRAKLKEKGIVARSPGRATRWPTVMARPADFLLTLQNMNRPYEFRTDLMVSAELDKIDLRMQPLTTSPRHYALRYNPRELECFQSLQEQGVLMLPVRTC